MYRVKWARVVCDEAHHLRNMNTRAHTAVMALKAELRWVFTGTPIQNSKDDFYGLCNIMGIKPSYYKDETNLKELAKNYLIKRTKEQVGIQLPELRVNNIQVEWENEKEKALAEALHNKLQFSGVNVDESSAGVRNLPEMNGSHFAKLMRSRQICILPEMVADGMPTIYDKEKLAYIREGLSSCSKVNAVVNHIAERKDNGRRKLMFCHFRDEMSKFEEELTALGLNVENLDGRTPQKERERILVSKDIDVLILQVNTCCEGLNLQHYKEMYFVTLHWNPAVHDQAVGRCYRLGQTEEVDVFIFQMEGFDDEGTTKTVDTYVGEVQEKKRELSAELDELCKQE
jgi:SNF2 family DNA or RNA helicase